MLYTRAGLRATVGSMLLDVIKRFEGGVRTPLPGLAGNQIAEDPSLLDFLRLGTSCRSVRKVA